MQPIPAAQLGRKSDKVVGAVPRCSEDDQAAGSVGRIRSRNRLGKVRQSVAISVGRRAVRGAGVAKVLAFPRVSQPILVQVPEVIRIEDVKLRAAGRVPSRIMV